MSRAEAHALLDRIRAGRSDAPAHVIEDALIATGDIDEVTDAEAWSCIKGGE